MENQYVVKIKKAIKKRIRKNFPEGFEMMVMCPHEVVEVSPTPPQANGYGRITEINLG